MVSTLGRLMLVCAVASAVLTTSVRTIHVADAQPAATFSADDEAQYVALINAVRAENGAGPLTLDPDMNAAARTWTAWMAENSVLEHADDIVTGAPDDWLKVGENVGRGTSVSVVWDAFLASPSHAANLLDPSFSRIGVGVVRVEGGRHYTTHRFASVPGGPTAPAEPTAPVEATAPAEAAAPADTGLDTEAAPLELRFEPIESTPPAVDPERVAMTMAMLLEAGRP